MTMKEMCEVIESAKILRKPDGTHPTARQIFEYSPTGELSAIWDWYDMARVTLGLVTSKQLEEKWEKMLREMGKGME